MHEKALRIAKSVFDLLTRAGETQDVCLLAHLAAFLRAVKPSEGMVEAIITEHIVIERSPHENIKSGTMAGLRKLAAELEGK